MGVYPSKGGMDSHLLGNDKCPEGWALILTFKESVNGVRDGVHFSIGEFREHG
jgi:hypothetical protein